MLTAQSISLMRACLKRRTAEQKAVTNWDDASCTMPKECRPHLIGVKDSSLVSKIQPDLP